MPPTPVDHEVLGLAAAVESLDAAVSARLFRLSEAHEGERQVVFHTSAAFQLFAILLHDLMEDISPPLFPRRESCVELLASIAATPQLAEDGSQEFLARPVQALQTWLDERVLVPVNFSAFPALKELKIARRDMTYICGNASKHSFARLTKGVSNRLSTVLNDSGVSVTPLEALLSVDEFYERFHLDVMAYHGTTLVELLNNVRWGIHEYLEPLVLRCTRQPDKEHRGTWYKPPEGLSPGAPLNYFWTLMNACRRGPYVERFVGLRYLKGNH